jgi:anti-sigma B factor antagonist
MSAPQRQRFELRREGDVAVVTLLDPKILDEENIRILGEQLFKLVDEEGHTKVLIRFGRVEFLSGTALLKFILLNHKLKSHQGRLVLCEINPETYEVFEITKMNKLFNIQKTEKAGLAAF